MNLTETDLGIEITFSKFLVFFGFKDTTLKDLETAYPNLKFQTMNQVHGKDIKKVTDVLSTEPKCDALVTQKKSIALVVKSADCIPIMIADEFNKKISAIHAGWKGVENKIFPEVLQQEFKSSTIVNVVVGPHITWPSFEVEEDVKDQLLKSIKSTSDKTNLVKPGTKKKSLVNLFGLIQHQAIENKISEEQFFTFLEDTKTSARFNSYRRDPKSKNRNLSFIAIP